ncbi:MBL fold metallo-hydrolase [Oceanobacillus saliphilus]|uniref:MBL fold metallo-hydrolase n=1 Tax=Oceanobacillus saliphilus TaxID=2925834 RepID=UPI00201D40F9|nr:MBL fold metallo-hydrolase [Oceanobacillus saliphilus]
MSNYEIIPVMVDVSSNLKSINFYIIKMENSVVLVDAGLDNDDCWTALQHTLSENGFTVQDITEIVLTHNHGDHIGLVNRITAMHPIPVYAHEAAVPRLKRDRDFFRMRVEFFAEIYEQMGCGEAGHKQVEYLKQAMLKGSNSAIHTDISPIGRNHLGFQVIHVPGHAEDQIALYHEADRILIAGDLLIQHISSNALIEPDITGKRIPTLIQHKHSLEKVRDLPLDLVYPGHGKLIDEPKSLVAHRLASMERKAERFKNLIRDGMTTGSEIARNYYKKLYTTQFSLVMSEVIGHLDYLEQSQQIRKEKRNGIWHYMIVESSKH